MNVSSTPLRRQSPGLVSHPCGLSSLVPKAAVCVEGAGEDVQANEPPEDPACLLPTSWTTVFTARQALYTKPLSLKNGGHSVLEQLSKVYISIK